MLLFDTEFDAGEPCCWLLLPAAQPAADVVHGCLLPASTGLPPRCHPSLAVVPPHTTTLAQATSPRAVALSSWWERRLALRSCSRAWACCGRRQCRPPGPRQVRQLPRRGEQSDRALNSELARSLCWHCMLLEAWQQRRPGTARCARVLLCPVASWLCSPLAPLLMLVPLHSLDLCLACMSLLLPPKA